MGFSIPNSSRTMTDTSTEPIVTPTTSGLRRGFQQSIAVRRRNAIVPGSLDFDALGSPRSPFIFHSRESRRARAERQNQDQQSQQSDDFPVLSAANQP